jgi:hypothetical protein
MSIRAGSIVTVAGRNVVDRLQSAGLGDARIPIETIREIGNDLVVDKVPGEADFTFTMESWDVTTDLIAFLHGKIGNQVVGQPPGYDDPAGTEYRWEDCQFVNITSPWKRNVGSAGGNISAGLLIPGYYPTRIRYRFGVTDNSTQEVELSGGSYYYAKAAPVEEIAAGDGIQTAFATSESARALRVGGAGGTSFRRVFGVIVNGVLQVKDEDYTETIVAADTGQSAVVTITFNTPPANLAQVRLAYFTETAKAYPQAVNADATVKPGAVRGRNVVIFVGTRGVNEVQSLTVDATGGNYTLGFNGYNTANLTPASTAAAVQAALEALPSIGAGNITVTGGPGGAGGGTPYVITFVGALGGTNVSAITSTNVSLAGGASTAVVTTTTPGGTGGNRVRLPGVQTFELEATVEGEVEREMGNEEITGRSVNGTDATGTVTFRPKDIDGFFTLLSTVTGVGTNEVYGYFNDHSVPVEIQIRNPKNPAQILKTIYMSDGQFQPPGTPARVNSPTDFATAFNSVNGTYSEFKGARP